MTADEARKLAVAFKPETTVPTDLLNRIRELAGKGKRSYTAPKWLSVDVQEGLRALGYRVEMQCCGPCEDEQVILW